MGFNLQKASDCNPSHSYIGVICSTGFKKALFGGIWMTDNKQLSGETITSAALTTKGGIKGRDVSRT